MRIANTLLVTGAALAAGLAFSAKPLTAALVVYSNDFEGGHALTNGSITTDQANSATHSFSTYGTSPTGDPPVQTPNAQLSHFDNPGSALPVLQSGESYSSFVASMWIREGTSSSNAQSYNIGVYFQNPNDNTQASFSNFGKSQYQKANDTGWSEVTLDLTTEANTQYALGRTKMSLIYASAYNAGTYVPFYIDDLQVNANVVPEPASLSLLGLGGLMLTARRKRA